MENDPNPTPPEQTSFQRLWSELKQRHVVRVASVYAIVGWFVIQVASNTFSDFDIPVWGSRFVVLMVVLGFPISLVVAWAFELTPKGVRTTKIARQEKKASPPPIEFTRKRKWMAYLAGAAVPTVIFSALAIFFYFRSGGDSPPVYKDKTIAVMPFEDKNPNPENASFALGIQDNILNALSHIKELDVTSRTSTIQYSNPQRNAKEIGKELGVNHLVEGSVWHAENEVQVTVQLIDTQLDRHLWSETYVRELEDQFAISSEIAKEVAKELQAVISPREIAQIERQPTNDLQAYALYLQGLEFQVKGTNEALKKSVEPFEAAIKLDPNFALAHVAKAISFRRRMTFYEPPIEMLSQVHLAATDAMALDPDSAEARSVLGMAYLQSWHWDDAWRYLNDSRSRNPRIADTHLGFALYYCMLGDAQRSFEALEEAKNRDPLNPEIVNWGIFTSLVFEDYDRAIKMATDNLPLLPDIAVVHTTSSWAYALSGNHEKAISLAEKAVQMDQSSPFFMIGLSQTYSIAGRKADARKALAEAMESDRYTCPYETAVAQVFLGEIDDAFESLYRAVAFRSNCLIFTGQDPRLEAIRNDPRYAKLLLKVGLDDASIQRYPR